MGWRLGYKRVSTTDQNTDRQLAGLEGDLKQVYEDKASGKTTKRPKLEELQRAAREGDTVVVHSLDRLARSLTDLKALVDGFNRNGVTVEFVKEGLTFAPVGGDARADLMLHILGAIAQFERALIAERQKEGIAKAKAKDAKLPVTQRKYRGRQPRVKNTTELATLRQALSNPKYTKVQIAEKFKMSRATLYTYIRRIQEDDERRAAASAKRVLTLRGDRTAATSE